MANSEHPLVFDYVNKQMGMHEVFRAKDSVRHGFGFTLSTFVEIKSGDISFPEPYFYFSEEFKPVAELAPNLPTLESYIRAKKPIFTKVGKGRLYLKITGHYTRGGVVLSDVKVIKFKGNFSGEEKKVGGMEVTPPRGLKDIIQVKVEEIFQTSGFPPQGFTRLDFYKWRLGYSA